MSPQRKCVIGNPGLAKGGSDYALTGIAVTMVMQCSIKVYLTHYAMPGLFLGSLQIFKVEKKHAYYDLMATDVIDAISNVYHTFPCVCECQSSLC